jgi:glucose-1-phosphate adenylyltransferase
VFADAVIGAGASVSWSILDRGTIVCADARIGGRPPRRPADSDHITLVGRDSRIGSGIVVSRGSRLEPGTTA